MQSEQFGAWARRNSVRATLIVAEFHERSFFVELLNDSTDLPASKSLRRKMRQQCHYVQDGRPLVHCTVCRIHRSTPPQANARCSAGLHSVFMHVPADVGDPLPTPTLSG